MESGDALVVMHGTRTFQQNYFPERIFLSAYYVIVHIGFMIRKDSD